MRNGHDGAVEASGTAILVDSGRCRPLKGAARRKGGAG